MRILLVPLAAGALLLSGCAVAIDIEVDSSGVVSTETAIEVPKSIAARPPIEADTLAEWEAWLQSPNGGGSLEDGIGNLIGSGGNCVAGEGADVFTVECTATGGAVDGLGGSGLLFVRTGTTVVVTLPVGSIGDVPDPLAAGLGLRATVTLPGTVTGVSGGAVQVDSDTVSMDRWDATAESMSGTFTLASDLGEPFPVAVAVGTPYRQQGSREFPWPNDNRLWTVGVTTETSNIDGAVTLYTCPAADSPLEECTTLGSGAANVPVEVTLSPGRYFIASRVEPNDWWNYDGSVGRTTVDVQSLRARVEPRIVGDPRPGKVLRVALGRWSPEPTRVHYRWVRVMSTEGGVVPALVRVRGGVGQGYRVVPGDVGYDLKVRVTMRGAGVPPRSIWIDGPTVESAS